MRFIKLLSAAMFAEGTGCLIAAVAWGCGSAYSATAACFCASAALFLLLQRRKPPEEG